jgi:hypothetical protein
MFPIATLQSLDSGVIVAEDEDTFELETTELELVTFEEVVTEEV